MFDSQDRRSALLKLFAGAATAVGARGASAAPDVDGEKKKNKKTPRETWEGGLVDPVYTPVGEGDTINYVITAQGGSGGMMDEKKKRHGVPMSDAQLFAYMQARSGGDYSGQQCFSLQGMNWRLMGADYDEPANTWRLQAKVCESNPDARPTTRPAAGTRGDVDAAAYTVKGCGCTCDDLCYVCGTWERYKPRCGSSYASACAGV